jgi:hypothetical protein
VLILLIAALVIAAAGGGGGGGMLSKRSSKKTRKQHNKRRSLSRSRPRTKSNSHSNRAAEGKSRHCKNLALATAHIRQELTYNLELIEPGRVHQLLQRKTKGFYRRYEQHHSQR